MNSLVNQPNSCPLCGSSRLHLHRWHSISKLRSEWKKGFGFDPFNNLVVEDHLYQFRCQNCDLHFYYPAICGDAQFYKELSSRFDWYYEKDKWEFDLAAQLISELPDVSRLLEVGCGYGHFLRRMNSLYVCHGLEFNPEAIQYCQTNGLDVTSMTLDSIEQTYDVVLAFEVLEHLSNPSEFLEKSIALLKSRGYLLLAVPNPNGYFSEVDHVLLDMPPHHVLSLSDSTFSSIANIFNLEILSIHQEPLRFDHYKSYISNFLVEDTFSSGNTNTSLRYRAIRKLCRLLGINFDLERRKLVDQLVAVQLAATYPSVKEKLIGQTHLVLFRKIA